MTGQPPAHADRRQQRRADQDRARPQRPLSLHAAAVARAAVRRHRQARLRPQGRPRARNRSTTRSKSSSAEEEQVLRHSQSDTQNPNVMDWTDSYARHRQRARSSPTRSPTSATATACGLIGLVGSCDLPGVALRRAQCILRWDRRPSLWSHAFLLVGRRRDPRGRAALARRPLPRARRQRDHRRPRSSTTRTRSVDPNVALLAVRMDADEADARRRARDREPEPRAPALRPVRDARLLAGLPVDARHPEPARAGRPEPLLGDGRVLLRGDPARPHARRQRPQQRARAPVERRALVERRVRRVRPPDRGPLRRPRPPLRGARARGGH